MKEKNLKRVSHKNQKTTRDKTIQQEPYKRDKYLGCPLRKVLGPFLKWTREKLKQMDQRLRKLMTIYNALHPRDDVDRLYVSRKEEGRGLPSIEDIVDASIRRLEDNIEKRGGRENTATRNNMDNTTISRTEITNKSEKKNNSMDVLSD